MIIKSSGFTLIELLVVVTIIGILSSIGIVSYNGYISGTTQKSAENAMLQISLAQTEYYSDNSQYYKTTEVKECSPDIGVPLSEGESSKDIEEELFGGGDVITKAAGYDMCIGLDDAGTNYSVTATNGATSGDKTLTMSANGVWGGK